MVKLGFTDPGKIFTGGNHLPPVNSEMRSLLFFESFPEGKICLALEGR